LAALKQKNRTISLIAFVLCLLLFTVLPGLAANGGGDGGGNGGGSGGLNLVSSFPQNNDKDVTLPVEIKLEFSKNVVNMSVKENNLKCFSLSNSEGKSVPIEVQMPDDQMEPDRKREIIVVPKEELDQGSSYTLKINAALISKSGVNLGKDIEITFLTQGESKNNAGGAEPKVETNSGEKSENPAIKVPPEIGQEAAHKTEVPTKVTETSDAENKARDINEPETSETEAMGQKPVTGESTDIDQPEKNQEVSSVVGQDTVDAVDAVEDTKSGSKMGFIILILIIAAGGVLVKRFFNKNSY
jgi:hypothetical protein